MSSTRIRAVGASLVLAAIAALAWLLVLLLGLWLDHHPEAPTALGIAEFVLALLVMPFGVGLALAWRQQTAAHLVGMSALAGVLAEWALLLAGGIITTVTDFERQIAYLSIPMNRLELLAVLMAFGLAGGLMGAAGGVLGWQSLPIGVHMLRGRQSARVRSWWGPQRVDR
jgi:hypothetical protein